MRSNKIKKIFWTGFVIICPAIPLSIYFNGNWNSLFHSYSVGMMLGIFSYICFLNTLIISSRIRYFDSIFGHDRVLIFHGYLAFAAISAAVGHYIFKSSLDSDRIFQTGFGIVGFYLFASIIIVTLLFMANSVLGRFKPVQKIRSFAEDTLRFDYSKLKLFHNCTIISVIFIAVHVLLAASTQKNLLLILIMGTWAAVSISFYLHHKFISVIITDRKVLTVIEVNKMTPEIVEIRMRNNKGKIDSLRAGQFGYFRLKSNLFSKEEHPFSISSKTGSDGLSITVKVLGDYTATLQNLPVGTEVLFDGPYGAFTPQQDGSNHIFIAGGIGITPFLSIISEWDFKGIKDLLTLVWSAKNCEEMIHRELFERIESINNKFLFVPVISRSNDKKTAVKHIDRILLESIVKRKETKKTAVYICGPESLRISVIKDLKRIGIPSGNIHCERFSF